MRTRILPIIALTCGLSAFCLAQSSPTTATTPASSGGSSAPYNEGPVWTLTMIKTKTGLADEYIKQITGTVKPVYDEEKKQKVILDYNKMDPVVAKVMGSEEQRKELAVKRLDVREILGTKTMREITLK